MHNHMKSNSSRFIVFVIARVVVDAMIALGYQLLLMPSVLQNLVVHTWHLRIQLHHLHGAGGLAIFHRGFFVFALSA